MSDQQHLFTLTTAEITQLASLDAISHCREVYGECLWLLIEADLRTWVLDSVFGRTVDQQLGREHKYRYC